MRVLIGPCPNFGKPTANMNDYSERHDSAYCSPFTSPACWEDGSGDTGLADADGRTVLFSDIKPSGD